MSYQDLNARFRPIDRWPGEETTDRRAAPFRAPWPSTLKLLKKELGLLGASEIICQVALDERGIRNDGYPRADAKAYHPGVILAFHSAFGPLKYACDTFDHWEDNIRAIALGLEALRRVERYGITKRGEQYTGFLAIPSTGPTQSVTAALEWLAKESGHAIGLLHQEEHIRRAYRSASRRLHPDGGGTPDSFALLGDVYRMLMIHYGFTP